MRGASLQRLLPGVGLVPTLALALSCTTTDVHPSPDQPYSLGRAATQQEVAAWDIDVGPDGHGLPDGSGDARRGAAIFAATCANCHGAGGEGTPTAAQLVRQDSGAVRRNVATHWPFAPPLFDYVRRTMPPDRPGSLPDDEVYSLVAFMLLQSGIDPSDVQDADSLARVKMPSRDRFVPDDRRGGREVK